MPVPVEVHIQEVFRDEPVVVLVNGTARANIRATTAFQTGLVDIESLDLEDGDLITVRLPDRDVEQVLSVSADHPFLAVTFDGNHLQVQATAQRPGYV